MDKYSIFCVELREASQQLDESSNALQKKVDKIQKAINKVTRGDHNASDLSAAYTAKNALESSVIRMNRICSAMTTASYRFAESSAELSGRANLTAYYMQHADTLSYESLMGTYTSAIATTGSAVAGYELVKSKLENKGYSVSDLGTVSNAVDDAIQRKTQEEREKNATVAKWLLTGATIVGGIALTVATGGAASPILVGAISGAVMAGGSAAIDQYAEHGWETDKWDYAEIGKDALVGGITGAVTSAVGGLLSKGSTALASKIPGVNKLLSSSNALVRIGSGAAIGSASEVISGIGTRGAGAFISTMIETNGDISESWEAAIDYGHDTGEIIQDAALGGLIGGAEQFKEWKIKKADSDLDAPRSSVSDNEVNTPVQESGSQYQYSSSKDIPDDVYELARGYQENPEWNTIIREGNTTPEIDSLKKVIDQSPISVDSQYVRKASLADLGKELHNLPLDELPGHTYSFEGIMSATGSAQMANSVSSGNVIYNIFAPAGTKALDLTNLHDFQEVMFNSPNCHIDSAKMVGYNTIQIDITIK